MHPMAQQLMVVMFMAFSSPAQSAADPVKHQLSGTLTSIVASKFEKFSVPMATLSTPRPHLGNMCTYLHLVVLLL